MYDTTQKVAADEGLVQDLRQWLWARAYAGTDDPACIDQAIIDSLGRSKSAAPATPGRAASVGSDANAAAGPSRVGLSVSSSHVPFTLLFFWGPNRLGPLLQNLYRAHQGVAGQQLLRSPV